MSAAIGKPNNVCGTRTGAGHLERIRVGAVISVAANAVDGAFAGGAAVDGALQAELIPLGGLEKPRWAGWKKIQENQPFTALREQNPRK